VVGDHWSPLLSVVNRTTDRRKGSELEMIDIIFHHNLFLMALTTMI